MSSEVKQRPYEKTTQKYGKILEATTVPCLVQKMLFLMITMNHQEQFKLCPVCSICSSH